MGNTNGQENRNINSAIENAILILKTYLTNFTDSFRSSNSNNNFYEKSGNVECLSLIIN